MIRNKPWIVVTDLDGTLLDNNTYAYADALPAIQKLKDNRIPIVLNTSKTFYETIRIRTELGIEDPFIVENGSCIYLPIEKFPKQPAKADKQDGFWKIILGESLRYIGAKLDDLRESCNFIRFSRCSIEQAINLTGLSEPDVQQAMQREFSEPIVWHDGETDLLQFKQQLKSAHLNVLRGGRFLHVQGICDKGMALQHLLRYYDDDVETVVLGDSENDLDMLACADISVIINSPRSVELGKLFTPDIMSTAYAPAGWSQAIERVLLKQQNSGKIT